jgi:hypothetical protein
MTAKIKILKDGLYNSIMLIYKEYMSLGYNEEEAKAYTSRMLREYLEQFGSNLLEDELRKFGKKLTALRSSSTDERECAELYRKIEAIENVLEIVKEVNSNGC